MLKNFFILCFFIIFSCYAQAKDITDEAQGLYKRYQQNVYQIQVVDKTTGKKSAIGSGFQISSDGYIATNFHVVSSAVNKPNAYRVELIRDNNTTLPLVIQQVDVIHDLAIVYSKEADSSFIKLGEASLEKGTRVFAMGNPHDLGMSIVEGTYNGLMKNSLYKKILFSGSLNPGMSGGPALNRDGEVIGVNVATAGNQISFFIPIEYLIILKDKVMKNKGKKVVSWKENIERQLIANQDDYMGRLLEEKWDIIEIGDALVPGEISGVFKCWGDSKNEESLYNYSYMNCSTEDQIFVSNSLRMGEIHYRYNWVTSKGLNSLRFYSLYKWFFSHPMSFDNGDKYDLSNFQCHTDFVTIDSKDWKTSFCTRNYRNYQNLYDINLSMVSVHKNQKGLIVDVVALGVTKKNAMSFVKKFMKAIQWKKL